MIAPKPSEISGDNKQSYLLDGISCDGAKCTRAVLVHFAVCAYYMFVAESLHAAFFHTRGARCSKGVGNC